MIVNNVFIKFFITGTVLADLILYRTCIDALSKNYTKCYILRSNASSKDARDLEAEIEPYATTIIMVKSLIESIIPAILSLFLGPWSDRGGRRPLLLAGLIGAVKFSKPTLEKKCIKIYLNTLFFHL